MAETLHTPARMATGIAQLDHLLGGGLRAGQSAMIKGPPGSGKTTFGLQMLVAGATSFDEPGLLLTFEQMPDQLFADASGFGWDLQGLTDQNLLKVLFVEPREVLANPGRHESRLLATIGDWAVETGARRIMIDSISHLRPLYTGEESRALFLNFIVELKQMGLTPIFTSELIESEGAADLDSYLVDAAIILKYKSGGVRQPDRRELQILKTRGYKHVAGWHPYEIGPQGVVVYTHDYPPAEEARAPAESDGGPLSSGVAGVDTIIAGGFTPGSAVLVAGLPGTFKTTLAASFVQASAQAGIGSLWIAFQETPAELERSLAQRGIDLAGPRGDGKLAFLPYTAGLEPVEKIFQDVRARATQTGARCIVIDGMNELTAGLEDEDDRQEAAQWFLRRLRDLGLTALFTQRLSKVTGRNPLSEITGADLADTIVYLGLVEIESRLEKVISVLKHRGGPAAEDLRSVTCTPRGLQVSDRFVGLSGILAGAPQGQRKAQIENIFQPLYYIRDFLTLAGDPSLDAERRTEMMNDLSAQTEKLIDQLSEHFDRPTS